MKTRLLVAMIAMGLAVVGCGDDAPADPAPSGSDTYDVASLVADSPTGEVTARAVLFDDGPGLRMCEVLAESFPPQCMGQTVAITNPDAVAAEFTTEGDIRWTDRVIDLVGTYADGSFTVASGS